MTGLISFAPEICSLICQDPTLGQLDLNSVCFISYAFRTEARRILSYRFPSLRGASHVKAWCLSLKRRLHVALDVNGLALWLPPPLTFYVDDINLNISVDLDYGVRFTAFLRSQPMLEALELHSGKTSARIDSYLVRLKSLACPPPFVVANRRHFSVRRLRLDFKNSSIFSRTLEFRSSGYLRSLAMFLKQGSVHFLGTMLAIVSSSEVRYIRHLVIHQLLPTQMERNNLPFPSHLSFPMIETLVLRPPPGPLKQASDDLTCAYLQLRSSIGRRNATERIMRILQTLTRLVLIVHEDNYEFRRDLQTGDIIGEKLIILNEQE